MKTGCFCSFLAVVGAFVVVFLLMLALDAILPASIKLNPEGIGRISGYFIWPFVAPGAFIYGYRRQARREASQPRPPENLRPIDYSRLSETIHSQQPPNDSRRSD